MLQFDLQFYEELTVAWVRTVKFISGAFFWPTGQLVLNHNASLLIYDVQFFQKRSKFTIVCTETSWYHSCVLDPGSWNIIAYI